jgi:hypothetical protein
MAAAKKTAPQDPFEDSVADDRYIYVEELDIYIVKADKKAFEDKTELLAYLNANAVEHELTGYADYLASVAEKELHKPAREAAVIERGPKTGQMRAAQEEVVPTQKMIDAFVARHLKAARKFAAWKMAQD